MKNLFNGIDTVILRVSNIDAACAWYHETIGFNVVWRDEKLKLAVLDTGGSTSLTIWETTAMSSPNTENAAYPIFGIADAASGRAELIRRGVRVSELVSDHVTTYFRFFDPDGNMLEACQVH